MTKSAAKSPAKRADSPLRSLYQRPGFLLRRAHQLSVGIFEDACRGVQLTPAQYGVLTVIEQGSGCDQSTVSRALGFDRVTTLRVVRGLEARGLIVRSASLDDGRRLVLRLTAQGSRLLAKARGPAEQAYRRLMDPLTGAEQTQLVGLLRKLCAQLESQARTHVVPPSDA